MTQVALPDPLEEVAPPRGRSGGAAWALWLARRLGLAVLSLWLVSVLVFLATVSLGDPVRAILGRDYESNVARREQLEAQLGVGDSLVTRYFDWLGGLFTGDFGTSLANQQPVWQQISSNVVNTLVLVLLAALVMIPLAFGIAMISAHYRRRRPDTVIQTILLALAGVPEFVTGILLVALFSTTVFHVFPAVTIVSPTGGHPWDDPNGMVLPVATLVLAVTPYVSRIVRATLLEVLDSLGPVVAKHPQYANAAVIRPPGALQERTDERQRGCARVPSAHPPRMTRRQRGGQRGVVEAEAGCGSPS